MPWGAFVYEEAEVLSGTHGRINYIDNPELLDSPEIEVIKLLEEYEEEI
jgi:hypothetical protein